MLSSSLPEISRRLKSSVSACSSSSLVSKRVNLLWLCSVFGTNTIEGGTMNCLREMELVFLDTDNVLWPGFITPKNIKTMGKKGA